VLVAPRPAADADTSRETVNKLGPHIQLQSSPSYEWARVAPIVKQMDGTNFLQAAPAGAVTIFRKYYQTQDIFRPGGDMANEIMAALGGFRPTYVELYNEPDHTWGTQLDRLINFTAEATAALHGYGLLVAGFSFSTGNPEDGDWLYIQANGFAGVDALAVHEYWGNQGFTEWNALRHRRIHNILGGNHPPFVITECGRDAVEGGAPGWIASGVSAEQYLGELAQYDQKLSEDSYVIGGTVFTCAPSPTWANFDMDQLVPAIIGTEPPPTRYRCSNGVCYPDANGAYASLADCQAACQAPPQRYRCVNGDCVADDNGPYGSFAECQAACGGAPPPATHISTSLLLGLAMGAIGAGILLAEYLGVQPEIELTVSDVQEIDADAPLPPGYQIIG